MAENPVLKAFGKWLTEAAARAGYSGHGATAKLARAAGLDPGQTSRFLNGHAAPSSANLPGLADAIGVTVDEMARRIAGMEIRPSDVQVTDATNLTPEQMIESMGVADPDDRAALLAMVERLRNRPAKDSRSGDGPFTVVVADTNALTRRDHRQRGAGGHPRPHTLKDYEQADGE